MKRKANIAVFVPHAGCKHRCSFCNQTVIAGKASVPTPQQVTDQLAQAVAGLSPHTQAEIGFFGGSFTAIDRLQMEALLSAALPFVDGVRVTGIRCSTRPDAITKETVALLRSYKVTAIELGAQSMDDSVLAANRRGHTALQVERASRLIRESGIELGVQMMTGLYTATKESDCLTARKLIALQPQTVRIYPTLVFENTHLATLYRNGIYTPPTLEETVSLCACLLEQFETAGVRVIKLGLHSDSSSHVVAGPCHPALRERVESLVYYERAVQLLGETRGEVTLRVNPAAVSKMIGQRRENLIRLAQMGVLATVRSDPSLPMGVIQKGEISCS